MKINIYHQDFLKNDLENNSIDVVVTSPPYNIGINYNSYNDNLPFNKYLEWTEQWTDILWYKLKDDGSFFLNIGCSPSNQEFVFQIMHIFLDHFRLQNTFHWIKSIAILKEESGLDDNVICGHFKPINSNRYVNNLHEYIFHFTKNENVKLNRLNIGVPYQDKTNIKRRNHESDVRCRGNVWYIPYETIQNRNNERPHPATFPVKLPEMCIKLCKLDNELTVLDPFMGIGNTALACIKTNSSFIGYDIDKEYCDITIQRINSLQNEQYILSYCE